MAFCKRIPIKIQYTALFSSFYLLQTPRMLFCVSSPNYSVFVEGEVYSIINTFKKYYSYSSALKIYFGFGLLISKQYIHRPDLS